MEFFLGTVAYLYIQSACHTRLPTFENFLPKCFHFFPNRGHILEFCSYAERNHWLAQSSRSKNFISRPMELQRLHIDMQMA